LIFYKPLPNGIKGLKYLATVLLLPGVEFNKSPHCDYNASRHIVNVFCFNNVLSVLRARSGERLEKRRI